MSATISACMMVRDGGELFQNTLNSLKGFVGQVPFADEIIVVNTDPDHEHTPDTELAESYGAKVYYHPWEDNFSTHRNQSINYATSDWVFIIDADEELIIKPNVNVERFKSLLNETALDISAYRVLVEDYQNHKHTTTIVSTRLFRNGQVHYENEVHNMPVVDHEIGFCPDILIHHFGYALSPEKMEAKFKRTVGLLQKKLEREPEHYETLFFLSQAYGMFHNGPLAIHYGEQYLSHKSDLKYFNSTIYTSLATIHKSLGNPERAAELIREGLEYDPDDLNLLALLSDHAADIRDNILIMESARRYIAAYFRLFKEPYRMRTKFNWFFKPDVLHIQAYRYCITCLKVGMDTWRHLKPNLPGPIDMVELRKNLENIGLVHLLDDLQDIAA